jgi:general stress protein 26
MTDAQQLTQDDVIKTMRSDRFVMLSTATADGKIVSHPMTPQQVTDDADVWFFIGLQGGQAEALRQNPQVNLAFAEGGSWLSVAGTAEFVDDRAKVDELWDGQVDAYFEQGKDDPNLGLLKVTSRSAEFWGVPGGRAAVLASIVKSKLTGSGAPGTSGTTEL